MVIGDYHDENFGATFRRRLARAREACGAKADKSNPVTVFMDEFNELVNSPYARPVAAKIVDAIKDSKVRSCWLLWFYARGRYAQVGIISIFQCIASHTCACSVNNMCTYLTLFSAISGRGRGAGCARVGVSFCNRCQRAERGR